MDTLTQTLLWFQGDYRALELQNGSVCLVDIGSQEGYPVYTVMYYWEDRGQFSLYSPDTSLISVLTGDDFETPRRYAILK